MAQQDLNKELHTAILTGDLNRVKRAVEVGAFTKVPGEEGNNALHLAARIGRKDIVEYLCQWGGVNSPNRVGRTMLHIAAENGHDTIVKYLIEEKHASVRAADADGETPLHAVLRAPHRRCAIAKYLIDHARADVHAMDKKGGSVLSKVSRMAHPRLHALILARTIADPSATSGANPLLSSRDASWRDVLNEIAERGLRGVDILTLELLQAERLAKTEIGHFVRQHQQRILDTIKVLRSPQHTVSSSALVAKPTNAPSSTFSMKTSPISQSSPNVLVSSLSVPPENMPPKPSRPPPGLPKQPLAPPPAIPSVSALPSSPANSTLKKTDPANGVKAPPHSNPSPRTAATSSPHVPPTPRNNTAAVPSASSEHSTREEFVKTFAMEFAKEFLTEKRTPPHSVSPPNHNATSTANINPPSGSAAGTSMSAVDTTAADNSDVMFKRQLDRLNEILSTSPTPYMPASSSPSPSSRSPSLSTVADNPSSRVRTTPVVTTAASMARVLSYDSSTPPRNDRFLRSTTSLSLASDVVAMASLSAALPAIIDALVDAASRGDAAAVQSALDAGAPIDACGRNGDTALIAAVRYAVSTTPANVDGILIAEYLCRRGADPTVAAKSGQRPVDIVAIAATPDESPLKPLFAECAARAVERTATEAAVADVVANLRTFRKRKGAAVASVNDADRKRQFRRHAAALKRAVDRDVIERRISALERHSNEITQRLSALSILAVDTTSQAVAVLRDWLEGELGECRQRAVLQHPPAVRAFYRQFERKMLIALVAHGEAVSMATKRTVCVPLRGVRRLGAVHTLSFTEAAAVAETTARQVTVTHLPDLAKTSEIAAKTVAKRIAKQLASTLRTQLDVIDKRDIIPELIGRATRALAEGVAGRPQRGRGVVVVGDIESEGESDQSTLSTLSTLSSPAVSSPSTSTSTSDVASLQTLRTQCDKVSNENQSLALMIKKMWTELTGAQLEIKNLKERLEQAERRAREADANVASMKQQMSKMLQVVMKERKATTNHVSKAGNGVGE